MKWKNPVHRCLCLGAFNRYPVHRLFLLKTAGAARPSQAAGAKAELA